MNTGKTEPATAQGFQPCVARYEACSIRRDPDGGYRVVHQACPERTWVMANLPTAHALCAELREGRYGCQNAPGSGI